MKRILFLGFFLLLLFTGIPSVFGAESSSSAAVQAEDYITQTLVGSVISVQKPSDPLLDPNVRKIEVRIETGSQKGAIVTVLDTLPYTGEERFGSGDQLIINRIIGPEGDNSYYIVDFVRYKPLYLLFFLFVLCVLIVGWWKGLASLLGLAFSFFVIISIIIPGMLRGYSPLAVAIFGCVLITPVTFYLSHGFSRKTTLAIVSTIAALVLTGALSSISIIFAHLSGFTSEESVFLETFFPSQINIRGLLLAGIIIGGLGVFDDVTVSQAAIVEELYRTNKSLGVSALYRKAMRIGRDHIASVVNTLVLVYTGSALPFLLLFATSEKPFAEVLNYEFIAEEIVRTLSASIGLILAVPLTTILAALAYGRKAT